MSKRVQFYDYETGTGKRRIFSFKVDNVKQAQNGLVRFNVQAGWYVEKSNGKVLKNIKIDNPHFLYKPAQSFTQSFFDKLSNFFNDI